MRSIKVTFNAGEKNEDIVNLLIAKYGGRVSGTPNNVEFYVEDRIDYENAQALVNGYTHEKTIEDYLNFLRFNTDLDPIDVVSFPAICVKYSVRTYENAAILASGFTNFQRSHENAPFIRITEQLEVYITFFEEFQYAFVSEIIGDSCKKDGINIVIPPFAELNGGRGKVRVLEAESKPTDNVNHPSHYNRGGIECIDAMIAAKGIEKVKIFCECNDFKYDWRRGEKDPILQDARKSRWYLDKFIELEEKHPTEIIEVDGHKYLRID